jgi:hypothetical protein
LIENRVTGQITLSNARCGNFKNMPWLQVLVELIDQYSIGSIGLVVSGEGEWIILSSQLSGVSMMIELRL